jgi:hypothetical protein
MLMRSLGHASTTPGDLPPMVVNQLPAKGAKEKFKNTKFSVKFPPHRFEQELMPFVLDQCRNNHNRRLRSN